MRTLTTIFLLTSGALLYGQDSEQVDPDCPTSVKLEYETLDSATIKGQNPLINIHFTNVVSYSSLDGVKLAYCTKDQNSWTSFLLPFSSPTNDFQLVNLDKRGQPELIVKGEILNYGSGGGTGVKGMLIINIDGEPTELFKIFYGCWDESFGDREKDGEGAYTTGYTRKIKIVGTTLIISPLDKSKFPDGTECSLTNIPAGSYVMEGGRIKKKK